MKKVCQYMMILLSLTLVSCGDENWFFHAVPYNDKKDNPEMVVTAELRVGEKPAVYVNESVFFLDPDHDETDTIYYGEYNYWETRVKTGFLRDAEVYMTINEGSRIRLDGMLRVDTIMVDDAVFPLGDEPPYRICEKYLYSTDYVLQPGDVVRIQVSHARYKNQVGVSQRMPMPVVFSLENASVQMANNRTALASCSVRIAPYQGDVTDLLCLRTTAYTHDVEIVRDYELDYRFDTVGIIDTVYNHSYVSQHVVYSQDISFVGYNKTNKSLSAGYYGATEHGLFRAVSSEESELTLMAGFNCYDFKYGEDGKIPYHSRSTCLDSIRVEVLSVTQEYYLYTASMLSAGYWRNRVSDVFGNSVGGNILGTIQDLFDEMGSMEGVQLYNNVDNAIGHVTASSSSACMLYPGENLLMLSNTQNEE